jgi:hypothetical protein
MNICTFGMVVNEKEGGVAHGLSFFEKLDAAMP